MNLPASFFIRPYSKKLFLFNNLKLRRIKNSMTHAAKNREMIHLWWHHIILEKISLKISFF